MVGPVALLVAASMLAGCGASGGDDATATTATTAPAATTAEDPGSTTSTTAGAEAARNFGLDAEHLVQAGRRVVERLSAAART